MTDIVERLRNPIGQGVMHQEAAAEIERLRADFESGMERFYSQGAELDNARAEIGRLTKQCEDCSYSELDMNMHVEAVTKELQAEIERLRTQCGGNCRYWEGRYRDEVAAALKDTKP